jgi:hypothetical protein
MASSFLNAAGTIGRVTINERIEAGRRERRVLARQHKSRDAQDPVPILVTGRIAVRRGQGQGQAGGELPPGARSGRGLVVSGRRETGPPGAFTLDPAEEGAGAAVDVAVAERLAGLRVVQDLAVAEAGLAVLEDVEGGGFELGQAEEPLLTPPGRLCILGIVAEAGEYGLDFGEVGGSHMREGGGDRGGVVWQVRHDQLGEAVEVAPLSCSLVVTGVGVHACHATFPARARGRSAVFAAGEFTGPALLIGFGQFQHDAGLAVPSGEDAADYPFASVKDGVQVDVDYPGAFGQVVLEVTGPGFS